MGPAGRRRRGHPGAERTGVTFEKAGVNRSVVRACCRRTAQRLGARAAERGAAVLRRPG